MSTLAELVKAYDIRGIVPDQLDIRTVTALGGAFAELTALPSGELADPDLDTGTRSEILVGYDMRVSSPKLAAAFAAGAAACGVDVQMLGLCSTDALYYASGSKRLPGAMITASHNSVQHNGIKLCRSGARPVGEETGLLEVRDLAAKFLADGVPGVDQEASNPGAVTQVDVTAEYAAFLRSIVDLSGIRPLRVVVDAANGMAGLTVPAVLQDGAGLPALPLTIIPLFFELDGTFPNHEANPLDPKNLKALQEAVVRNRADLGLAFDGDADRCFVVDEHGRVVHPSAIAALVCLREIARERLAGRADVTVIYNLISSRILPELMEAMGANAVRSRVGHSFVKTEMATHLAVFGAEHSAHFYFRDFFFADSGMLAAMHVLAAIGERNVRLSDLADQYQPYFDSGEINSEVDDPIAVLERVRESFSFEAIGQPVEIDSFDGLTLSTWDTEGVRWWLNVRPAHTESLLRLNVEAEHEDVMIKVRDAVLAVIRDTDS